MISNIFRQCNMLLAREGFFCHKNEAIPIRSEFVDTLSFAAFFSDYLYNI